MKVIEPKQDNINYKKRPCVYVIIQRDEDDKIAIVKETRKKEKLLIIGGGIEKGEDKIQALEREVLEETGYSIKDIKKFDDYVAYINSETRGYLEIEATIYIAKFDKKISEPIEENYEVLWGDANIFKDKMYVKPQRYILNEYLKSINLLKL